jgi:hypothetical protein
VGQRILNEIMIDDLPFSLGCGGVGMAGLSIIAASASLGSSNRSPEDVLLFSLPLLEPMYL